VSLGRALRRGGDLNLALPILAMVKWTVVHPCDDVAQGVIEKDHRTSEADNAETAFGLVGEDRIALHSACGRSSAFKGPRSTAVCFASRRLAAEPRELAEEPIPSSLPHRTAAEGIVGLQVLDRAGHDLVEHQRGFLGPL
jgi:hypothetical protein